MKGRANLPFVREHRTYCGAEYMTVNLFQYTEEQGTACRKSRKRREKLTPPKQLDLNDRNAKRYLVQLLNANFTGEDMVLHLTYTKKFLPRSEEEDLKNVENFLRRVNHARKKAGLPPMKRVWVPQGGNISKKTGKRSRFHHHIVISGGLDRDLVESLWTTGRGKNRKPLGYANADRLQPGENGLEALGKYLYQSHRGVRRWRPSKNLTKPERTTNDHKYSCRKLRKLCESGTVWSRDFWQTKYPGYTLAGAPDLAIELDEPDEMNSWRVYAKLRKLKGGAINENRRRNQTLQEIQARRNL